MHTKKPETLKEEVIRSFLCPVTIAELGRINILNVKERVSVKWEVTKVISQMSLIANFYVVFSFIL